MDGGLIMKRSVREQEETTCFHQFPMDQFLTMCVLLVQYDVLLVVVQWSAFVVLACVWIIV